MVYISDAQHIGAGTPLDTKYGNGDITTTSSGMKMNYGQSADTYGIIQQIGIKNKYTNGEADPRVRPGKH